MFVDPILRQTFEYVNEIPCDNLMKKTLLYFFNLLKSKLLLNCQIIQKNLLELVSMTAC